MRKGAPFEHKKFRIKNYDKPTDIDKLPRREIVIMFLEEFYGYSVVEGRSNKFLTMEKPGVEKKYFVGTKGALKFGKNVSSAISTYPDVEKMRQKLKTLLK